jgi:predicted RNase H-like nuclease
VLELNSHLAAFVAPSFQGLLSELPETAIVAIDVPIGLPEGGPRACDVEARRLLRVPRASSVFAAPVRPALIEGTFADVSDAHFGADGRRISRQAFAILPKVREVDDVLRARPALQARVREVHPEVCFAVWNDGRPMRHRKGHAAGRAEREALIDARWPGRRARFIADLRRSGCRADDLNDAFAALWTARRIRDGVALVLPDAPQTDRFGLRMEMLA